MKHILLISFLICTLSSFGQSKEWKEIRKQQKEHQARADTSHFPSPFEFTFIDSSNYSKQELFSKINTWLPTVFTNSNIAITKDSASGRFVLARVQSSHSSDYTYNLTIDVKNNKYRLAFTNYTYKANEYYTYSMNETDKIKIMVIGSNKNSYWKNEKLYLMEDAESIFYSAKSYIEKKDDF